MFPSLQHCEPSASSTVKRSARCLLLANVMSILDYHGCHVHTVTYFRPGCVNIVSNRQNGARAERNQELIQRNGAIFIW